MFCMGQGQSKGVELEDKVVESQPYSVTRTMKVPQICINIVLTHVKFKMFWCNDFVNCFAIISTLFAGFRKVNFHQR
jgi:hypothetical protein